MKRWPGRKWRNNRNQQETVGESFLAYICACVQIKVWPQKEENVFVELKKDCHGREQKESRTAIQITSNGLWFIFLRYGLCSEATRKLENISLRLVTWSDLYFKMNNCFMCGEWILCRSKVKLKWLGEYCNIADEENGRERKREDNLIYTCKVKFTGLGEGLIIQGSEKGRCQGKFLDF